MAELYFVQLLVEPTTHHPLYFEAGVAVLTACLWADSPEEAERRVGAFAETAQWHVQEVLRLSPAATPPDYDKYEYWARSVRTDGFAFSVRPLATGADLEIDSPPA